MRNFTWKKRGKVFDPAEHSTPEWMTEFAQAPSTLIFDEFVRVYFSCRPKPNLCGQYVSYSGFVDLNRKNLHQVLRISGRPILSLGDLGAFDEFGVYPVSVIKYQDEYWAYYGGWTRCVSVPFNVGIGLAKSIDGVTFKRVGLGPILPYSKDEPYILSGPKIRRFNNKFHLFYICGKKWIIDNGKPEPVYKIRLAISDDGVHWTKQERDLLPDKIDIYEAQASPDVFFYKEKYHMYFCYRCGTNYRGKANGYRIGYAYSEDLLSWNRDDSKAGITVSDNGWDSEMISYPHIFELDGKMYMFYLGNQVGKHGFGLASLESDS